MNRRGKGYEEYALVPQTFVIVMVAGLVGVTPAQLRKHSAYQHNWDKHAETTKEDSFSSSMHGTLWISYVFPTFANYKYLLIMLLRYPSS